MICYFKFEIKPVPCTNTHHDVTDLVNHWMVENTKTWTSWEQNRNFLQNKKNLTILRSLTFNKNVSNEFDFLHADKHGSLLQIDTTILMGWSTISKVSKIASLQCLFNISKKKLEKKFTFSLQINIKVSYNTFGIKFCIKMILPLMVMIKHSQSIQSNIFASLQHLYKISKKKLGVAFIFCT